MSIASLLRSAQGLTREVGKVHNVGYLVRQSRKADMIPQSHAANDAAAHDPDSQFSRLWIFLSGFFAYCLSSHACPNAVFDDPLQDYISAALEMFIECTSRIDSLKDHQSSSTRSSSVSCLHHSSTILRRTIGSTVLQ